MSSERRYHAEYLALDDSIMALSKEVPPLAPAPTYKISASIGGLGRVASGDTALATLPDTREGDAVLAEHQIRKRLAALVAQKHASINAFIEEI